MDLCTKKLTEEEIKMFRDHLSRATPYTQKEIDDMPLDICDFDLNRMRAFNAQRALKEAGLL